VWATCGLETSPLQVHKLELEPPAATEKGGAEGMEYTVRDLQSRRKWNRRKIRLIEGNAKCRHLKK
jgi:hypothetical protein